MRRILQNGIALAVVIIVLFIVVPLPTPLLDVLLVVNISLSMLILVITMTVADALDFSIFPSLLLITTLFRLGLNVSTTRAILGFKGNGVPGTPVIQTFGNLITQGNIVLGIIICVYLLAARKSFSRQGKALVYAAFKPEWAEAVLKELSFIDKTFVGFFGGKILDSAIVGLICYVFCAVMTAAAGFQNAVLISVIIGVTNVIPYFGPFIGAVPAALLILISSPRNCLIFLIFIVILQQFDGNILGPKLLAGSVGLTGFWVLFAITLFQGVFGFIGILVGVPVFAVIYDLVRRWIVMGLKKHGRLDMLQ